MIEPRFDEYNEMVEHFKNRTKRHIQLVQKYATLIESQYHSNGLAELAKTHDASKFSEPEYSPYLHVSWKYKMQDEGKVYNPPEFIRQQMTQATEHHVKSNKHHPEAWTHQTNTINPNNRDEPPKEMIDATKMPDIYIAEMCADWLAMAEEKGTSVREWANKNVNIRWKFNENQINQIYRIIDVFNFDNK